MSAEQKQEAVVKPLEWIKLSHGWIAHAAFGSYQIETWQEHPSCLYWQGTMLSLGDDDEAAKAAAQADYEARIRSALVVPANPSPPLSTAA